MELKDVAPLIAYYATAYGIERGLTLVKENPNAGGALEQAITRQFLQA